MELIHEDFADHNDSIRILIERVADLDKQIRALRSFIWAHVDAHQAIPGWTLKGNLSEPPQ